MDDDMLDKIYLGDLNGLVRPSTKLVRLFMSSTFTDMLLERNTLMQEVFPRIKQHCRHTHGIDFQVVDMRWGVRDEMTNEHMTTQLCMTELKACQNLSIGPNFIYLGGQKYGYRPIPTIINSQELRLLRETLIKMCEDVSLLDKWYITDTNNVPPVAVLQPIDTYLPHFLNKREPALQVIFRFII